MKNTTHSNTEKLTEEAASVIEHEELETLITASIETLKRQKMKCGIRNLEVDGCPSNEYLFGQSALLRNATYIVFL